jgi:ABC-type bacteriocin/lantibiotic exporter with double-glycine peptidase domain
MAETPTMSTAKSPLRRIFEILRLEKKEISSIYFYAALNGLIQLSLPLGIQSIISFVLGGSISTSLVILIILVVLGVLMNGFISVNQMKLIEKVQQQIFVRYSFEYANRIPKLELASVDSYYLPELVNRFFDTVSLQKGISKLLLDFPTATIQIVFGLILLSFYHPIFIVFSILLIFLVYIIMYYTGARGLETSLTESAYKYRVAGWLEELARVVRSFKFSKGSNLSLKRTDTLVNGYLNARTNHFRILLLQYWTLIGFKVLITAAMLIVGSVLLIDQELNLGQFIAAEIVILLVLNSVEKLIINLDKVYDVLTAVDKLSKVTDKPMEREGDLDFTGGDRPMKVELNELRFGYNGTEIIKNISFIAEPGSKNLIIGADGSGKSTLLRVLSGVYGNYSGSFLLNNIPIKNYQPEGYRKRTGILLSQQDIFFGSLLENITMGDTDIKPEQIMELASSIGLEDFLLGNGFDTILDPVGKRLSRSVIQKILLLRALINKPGLLLLEEPWREFEPATKQKIVDYLINNKNVTVIAESNDLSIAPLFDNIIYMKEGQLKYAGKFNPEIINLI